MNQRLIVYTLAPGEPGTPVRPTRWGCTFFDLPTGLFVTGDKANNDYTIEDVMRGAGRELIP